MTTVKTSATDPIRVDWLPIAEPGKLGLTFAPGKRAASMSSEVRWDRELTIDLDRLVNDYDVSVLVCLLEAHELQSLAIPSLVAEAVARGIKVLELPIRDTGTPASMSAVAALVAEISAEISSGANVVIHCHGGLGRTGTIAGCYLVDHGLSAPQALRMLNETRGPRCPENVAQQAFIARYAARDRAKSVVKTAVETSSLAMTPMRSVRVGVVLGAAIGDAMGHPTEFLSMSRIHEKFGPAGVAKFELYWDRDGKRFAPYTDDTQMAECVLKTLLASRESGDDLDATMVSMATAFVQWAQHPQGGHRAPGSACLAGCKALAAGTNWREAGGETAGGCGSVMRAYPFGLVFADDVSRAERWAVEHSKLTHRDPIALAACAAMAVGVAMFSRGSGVNETLSEMVAAACRYSPKTAAMMAMAIDDARTGVGSEDTLDRLRGWAAHEAIAAAVYVVQRHPDDARTAILEGANTPGDSDSIATLAGALVGARVGHAGLPVQWVHDVERSDALTALALAI